MHNVWVWRAIIRVPFLAIFIYFTLPLVWSVLPAYLLLLPTLVVLQFLAPAKDPFVVLLVNLHFLTMSVVIAPVFWPPFLGVFGHYFTLAAAMFGFTKNAQVCADRARDRLEAWSEEHG